MPANSTILITGASGFIGGRLVEVLHLTGAARPRAGLRQWSSAARIARFPVELVLCDITNPDQIAEAMRGTSAVVHCAHDNTWPGIVAGTQNMLNAAQQAGIQRFVHLSTTEVYGNVAGSIDETHGRDPAGREYAAAKIEAENLCRSYLAQGLPVTILRPSIVYGPFSQSWTIDLAARLQSGNWGTFAGYGEGICNLVYVDDLISAILLTLNRENAVGQTFNVNGLDKISWNDYFSAFNAALERPKLNDKSAGASKFKSLLMDQVNTVSGFFVDQFEDAFMDLYLRGGLAYKLMRSVKDALNSTPSMNELQHLFSRQAYYSASKAKALLGYDPRYNLAAGLRLSVLWLRHHGYV